MSNATSTIGRMTSLLEPASPASPVPLGDGTGVAAGDGARLGLATALGDGDEDEAVGAGVGLAVAAGVALGSGEAGVATVNRNVAAHDVPVRGDRRPLDLVLAVRERGLGRQRHRVAVDRARRRNRRRRLSRRSAWLSPTTASLNVIDDRIGEGPVRPSLRPPVSTSRARRGQDRRRDEERTEQQGDRDRPGGPTASGAA